MSNSRYVVIIVLIGIVVIAGVIMFGKSDSGQINVNDAINNSNQQKNSEGGNAGDIVGTTPAALRNLPNGGLVPQDPNARPPAPEPEPIVEDENASSTDDEIEDTLEGDSVEDEEGVESTEVVPET